MSSSLFIPDMSMGAQIPTKHIHQCPVADSANPVLDDMSSCASSISAYANLYSQLFQSKQRRGLAACQCHIILNLWHLGGYCDPSHTWTLTFHQFQEEPRIRFFSYLGCPEVSDQDPPIKTHVWWLIISAFCR